MTTHDPDPVFRVWNAHSVEPGALAFDVTRANMPRIAAPDRQWVAAACRALGAPGPATECRVTPMRSSFFSDYPDDEAVEDRWPDCWVVETALPGDQTVPLECGVVPAKLGALDPSWAGGRDPGHDARALVMAVGAPGAAPAIPDEAIAAARRERLRPTSAEVIPCAGGRPAIRLVTSCAFPDDAGALEGVTRALRAAGWATTWRAVLSSEGRPGAQATASASDSDR